MTFEIQSTDTPASYASMVLSLFELGIIDGETAYRLLSDSNEFEMEWI